MIGAVAVEGTDGVRDAGWKAGWGVKHWFPSFRGVLCCRSAREHEGYSLVFSTCDKVLALRACLWNESVLIIAQF